MTRAPVTRRRKPAGVAVPAQPAAVLLAPLDDIPSGYVVRGAEARIKALTAGDQARPATAHDLTVAGLNVRDLD